jgi:hypothetical protein
MRRWRKPRLLFILGKEVFKMSKEAQELAREIAREKQKLVKIARSKGLYEDFGQKEYGRLMEKYGDLYYANDDVRKELDRFFDWCVNFTIKRG